MDVKIDSSGVYVGSKHYIGVSASDDYEDIGVRRYDGKIFHYPDGRHQIVKASKKVFRIPVPGVLPFKQKEKFLDDYDPDIDLETSKKREDNLERAKTRVKQIIMLNQFHYFITLTFNDEIINASNIPIVLKKTQTWLKNMTQRHNFAYLLVPEFHHKKNRVHLHLLANGENLSLGFDEVYKVEGFKKPMRMAKIKRKGLIDKIICPVYNLKDWNYGLSTVIECYGDNFEKLSNYVLKEYVTKNTDQIFGKYYWCSKNLKLYPDVELFDLDYYEFRDTPSREYWHGASGVGYKYINRLGFSIDEGDE